MHTVPLSNASASTTSSPTRAGTRIRIPIDIADGDSPLGPEYETDWQGDCLQLLPQVPDLALDTWPQKGLRSATGTGSI